MRTPKLATIIPQDGDPLSWRDRIPSEIKWLAARDLVDRVLVLRAHGKGPCRNEHKLHANAVAPQLLRYLQRPGHERGRQGLRDIRSEPHLDEQFNISQRLKHRDCRGATR